MRSRLWSLGLAAILLGIDGEVLLPKRALAQEGSTAASSLIDRLSSDSQRTEDGKYFNRHSFEGKAEESVTLELISDTFDSYLILLDPNGAKIAENNDGRNGKNALITTELSLSGTYTIMVVAYGFETGGEYKLSLRAPTKEDLAFQTAEQFLTSSWQQLRSRQFREALQSSQQALEIYKSINAQMKIRTILNNIGVLYLIQQQYQKAIEFHQQVLELDRDLGDRRSESISLANIGSAYEGIEQYDKALEFYQKSLVISREVKDLNAEGDILQRIGIIYYKLNQYIESLEFYQQSLIIYREVNNDRGEYTVLENIASVYQLQKQFSEALDFYRQALTTQRKIVSAQ
jgi:tetratricopeptide (TPR) repeat protein